MILSRKKENNDKFRCLLSLISCLPSAFCLFGIMLIIYRWPVLWQRALSTTACSIVFLKLVDLAYFRLVWWFSWSPSSHDNFTLTCLLLAGALLAYFTNITQQVI